jgi:hypothetical protein
MCWNAQVSLIFGLFGLASATFLYKEGVKAESCQDGSSTTVYKKAAKWHALFVANIAMVEICEFIIWLGVLPMEAAATTATCPTANMIGTYGVFMFGFVNWSWLIATWCYYGSNDGNDKDVYKLWMVLGYTTAFGYIVKIILGDTMQIGNSYWEHHPRWTYNASVPVVTCSYHEETKYNHLAWRFNTAVTNYLPSGYSWFATSLMPMLFYKPFDLAAVCFSWGALTFAVPRMVLPRAETMSLY